MAQYITHYRIYMQETGTETREGFGTPIDIQVFAGFLLSLREQKGRAYYYREEDVVELTKEEYLTGRVSA